MLRLLAGFLACRPRPLSMDIGTLRSILLPGSRAEPVDQTEGALFRTMSATSMPAAEHSAGLNEYRLTV